MSSMGRIVDQFSCGSSKYYHDLMALTLEECHKVIDLSKHLQTCIAII